MLEIIIIINSLLEFIIVVIRPGQEVKKVPGYAGKLPMDGALNFAERRVHLDKPARLIIIFMFGFGSDSDSDSIFVKLNKSIIKY